MTLPTGDLLALTAALVDIPSTSHAEGPLVDLLEAELRPCEHLVVDRVGDNLVARTVAGRDHRIVLAGHTDTVPANGNAVARVDGDVLWGLGAADMKGGVAVLLELARTITRPVVDVTYVLYAREEVAAEHNGLGELAAKRPELLEADVALLGEPTGGAVEAGCQGTMRLRVTLVGERAHTARAWMGRNAIHRLAEVLGLVAAYAPRLPVLAGCRYHEALQAVAVTGGVAGNVVPDEVSLTLNHRFAPDRSPAEAEAHVRAVLAPALEPDDRVELVDISPAAAPGLDHQLLSDLVRRSRLEVRAKLGWTDVAFFAGRGVPASNFGPGDAALAHTAGERVDRTALEAAHDALRDLLTVVG
ncbi:MAG: succinyl-diaminopimelate desuccinylase [Acidimicrobiales bacterium]